MKAYEKYLIWILVVGGLLVGYEGLTGTDLLEQLLGGQVVMAADVLIGAAAVLVGANQLSGKKRK